MIKNFKSFLHFLSPSIWLFFLRNLFLAYRMPVFSILKNKGLYFEPLKRDDLILVSNLYSYFNHGLMLDFGKKTLLWLAGKRLCLIVRNFKGEIIGFSLFYFNLRDKKEQTVHEGFIGLKPDYQGKGIGTEMSKYALKHFATCGLKGVSSRVSVSNTASLNRNLNIGYVPVEIYYDSALGEERYYMIRWFE